MVVYREIGLRDPPIFRRARYRHPVIMFIIANAGLFAYLITRAGVPDAIGHFLRNGCRARCCFCSASTPRCL